MATHLVSRRRQAGLTMIELLAALAISSLIVVALAAAWRAQGESRREDSAAEHAKTVIAAVQEYTRNNFSTIVAAAGPSTPYTVSAATLQASTAWPTGVSTNNAFSQSFVVRIIEPSTNRLEALILYTGGETLTTGTLRSVASKIGLAGGYVSAEEPATAYGMMRAWSKSLAAFGGNAGAGKVAASVFAADAMAIDDYLHRSATPGKPELNRMSTAIDMANNNVNNAGTVAATDVNASNGIRANNIAIGKAEFGAFAYPYETIQLANGLNMRFAIGSREHTVMGSDGNLTTHGSLNADGDVNGSSVNMRYNVTANGNISAGGSVSAGGNVSGTEVYASNWFRSRGNGGWYSEPYGGGFYMSDATWIRAYNNKNIYTGGEVRGGQITSDGNANFAGRTTVGEYLQLNGQAGEGGGCGPNGLIGRTPAGKTLWCENGVWRSGGGLSDVQVVAGGYSQGPVNAYANCPGGYFLLGGGYQVISMQKASSQEAPQINRPGSNTAWFIYAGGSTGARESNFQAWAVCGR
ncbi:shufflon system plasmid conjugative transfer pilus tip adhesin PilV [Xanthomonas euvesicatoria]|uniref:shufflon system plasmid conjugative transfer pilus tip adhesin PilV n=1 Tax=Xanthomonas euvesicatoria TaxID=456327 RepID=UPI0021E12A43|nr:shufflon system plasmid conjugative transfer pilus tip adhesin PilV [Xanthomonas euvesicatoria]